MYVSVCKLWKYRAVIFYPGGSDGNESACNAGSPGSIPGSGIFARERNGNPLQYSCLENPMDRGAWQVTVHGITKVGHDLMTKPLQYIYTHTHIYILILQHVKSIIIFNKHRQKCPFKFRNFSTVCNKLSQRWSTEVSKRPHVRKMKSTFITTLSLQVHGSVLIKTSEKSYY